ncbi:MAG: hypothetical protein ACP5QT_00215 [Brevinematia bacterium]
MKVLKSLFVNLVFLFLFYSSFFSISYVQTYKIVEINKDKLTQEKISAFTNSLISNLIKYKFTLLRYDEVEDPAYLIFFDFDFQPYEELYVINVKIRSSIDKTFILSDSIYTRDVWGTIGFENAGKNLAKRIFNLLRGKVLPAYREIPDYRKYYRRIYKDEKSVFGYELLDFINVGFLFNEGINSENSFGISLKLLEYSKIFMLPHTPLGIGFGVGIFDLHSTNAGGILPLTLYIPIYIFPDDYEFNRKNIFIAGEWCGLFQRYSYYDISLRFYYNGVGLKIGWIYYPAFSDKEFTRNETSKFYGGIFFYIGNFDIELVEKPVSNKN